MFDEGDGLVHVRGNVCEAFLQEMFDARCVEEFAPNELPCADKFFEGAGGERGAEVGFARFVDETKDAIVELKESA
jgi:hypothetical protein